MNENNPPMVLPNGYVYGENVSSLKISIYLTCSRGSFLRKTRTLKILMDYCFTDCKTVRIFAYSSTREQSNKRSGTRLKTESETGERR